MEKYSVSGLIISVRCFFDRLINVLPNKSNLAIYFESLVP